MADDDEPRFGRRHALRVTQAAGLFVLLALTMFGVLNACSREVWQMAFAPIRAFAPQPALAARDYAGPELWLARPGLRDDPAQWLPAGVQRETTAAPGSAAPPRAAVFYVHSTTYLSRAEWNAPISDADSQRRAGLLTAATASAFSGAGPVWVPRYRQAALGAFLSTGPDRQRAIDVAYGDVAAAFGLFVEQTPAEMPIVIAGHSQGALLVARLLRDRVRGTPLARRVAAAYAIGWPMAARLAPPALGLPVCAQPDQAQCLVSWMSFAAPADPSLLLLGYHVFPDGTPADATLVCVNPLSGRSDRQAMPASANRGTLLPDKADLLTERAGPMVPAQAGAACDARGLLVLDRAPRTGQFVLPGNNYHVYDIPLFWANLRADVIRRTAGWYRRHPEAVAAGEPG
ncbi:DUF3089 domain-containing protein [Novosphingobium sp.]|uniref:DUF3089 domain-containing protein n=1 Tax=Novosphingobium sp. TaxID=1874826 RepID=UPI002FDE0B95